MTLLTCLKRSSLVFCLFALYFNLIFVSFSLRELVNLSSISHLGEQWISNKIFGLQSLCLPKWVKRLSVQRKLRRFLRVRLLTEVTLCNAQCYGIHPTVPLSQSFLFYPTLKSMERIISYFRCQRAL